MRLEVRGKLFAATVVLVVAAVASADLLLAHALGAAQYESVDDSLRVRLALVIERLATIPDVRDLDEAVDAVAAVAGARVTVVGGGGVVLGDSELDGAALAGIGTHADRPEVQAALRDGAGRSVRDSGTVNRRMLYHARRASLANGEPMVVRVAVPLQEVDAAVGRLHAIIAVATLAALGVALLLGWGTAHHISRKVRGVTAVARQMAAGDLGIRVGGQRHDELGELGRALDALASGLSGALGELRVEHQRLRAVLDGLPEGVLLLDVRGEVVFANPALRAALALDGPVVGRSVLELVRSVELKALLDKARATEVAVVAEVEVAGATPRRLRVHAAPLGQAGGGVLAGFVDVTELRRLEVVRRDFVANVSHELRTPVAALRGAAETLALPGLVSPAGLEFVAIVERQSQRLGRLIEDLLDLSRIEARRVELAALPIDASALVEEILALMAPRAEARQVTLVVDPSLRGVTIQGDRRGLDQILSNLVDNAIKYGRQGGRVVVDARGQGRDVELGVADDGAGIEAVHLSRLFERFYRVDAGRSRESGGTGLGLSIVRHLAEAMGGEAGVDSEVGRGSRFWVRLPRAGFDPGR